MADENRKEDQDLGKIFEESFGFSEQEILADIEKAETSEDFPDFDGAEERIFRKLMERKAEEEKKKSPRPVRLKKKKAALVAALVAVFVLMLGITAIGGKNYFFRIRTTEKGIVLNNDKVIMDLDKLEEAYIEAQMEMGDTILKLGYIPEEMEFEQLTLYQNRASFKFMLNNDAVYFIQEEGKTSTSINIESDRDETEESVYNKWIGQSVQFKIEELDGQKGLSASFVIKGARYYITGKIDTNELKKIIENLKIS